MNKHVYYKDDIYVGYRHFNTHNVKPQFAFGFGLSYTTFKYGKPVFTPSTGDRNLSRQAVTASSPRSLGTVAIDITNTGTVEGKETVQLYISDTECSVPRPAKELKGFQKVSLKPGETKTVTFSITEDMLQFWSEAEHRFTAEPGQFKAHLCASETDIRGSVAFMI